MKNKFLYIKKCDVISSHLLSYTIYILIAFFSLNQIALAQKAAPVPGKGGTVGVRVYSVGPPIIERGFEVDAHFQSGIIPDQAGFWVGTNPAYVPSITTYGDDWSGPNGVLKKESGVFVEGETDDKQTVWKVDGNSGNKSTRPEIDVFAGTSNKNSDFIGASQSPWSVKIASGGPQKNDITNIYLHTRLDKNGKKWLFFAFETRSTDGTSYGDIEFNQAGLEFTPPNGGNGSLIGNGPLGGRSLGDFILSVDFSGGGTQPKIAARTVLANGSWSSPQDVGEFAYLATNIKDVFAVKPGAAFNGDGSASNTTYAFQLIEGGINLTDAGLEPTGCTPSSTMIFKTRSSDSFTAELKDLSLVPFAITPPATLLITGNQTVCPTESASFTATVSGPGADAENVQWFKCSVTTVDGQEVLNCPDTPLSTGGNYKITPSSTDNTSKLEILSVASDDVAAYKAFLPEDPACGAPSKYSKLILNSVSKPYVVLTEATICGNQQFGTLKVCNPVVDAYYTLKQIGAGPDNSDLVLHDNVKYTSGPLEISGLKAGYGFDLKINRNGCEATTTCADNNDAEGKKNGPDDYIRETCTGAPQASSTPSQSVQIIDVAPIVNNLETISTNTEGEKLTAYPVPFSGKATVEFRMANTERYEINLYDMKGTLIKQLKSGKAKAGELQQVEVDGQKLPEGMYLVRVISSKGAQTVKLLKKE